MTTTSASSSLPFTIQNVASVKPVQVNIPQGQIRYSNPASALKITTLTSNVIETPFFTFQLVFRPGIINVNGTNLDVSLIVSKLLDKYIHFECQMVVEFTGSAASVPPQRRLFQVFMCNVSNFSHFVTTWLLPSNCIDLEYRFANAFLTFYPMAVVDSLAHGLRIQHANTLLGMLNSSTFSDCQLLPAGDNALPIHVSRAILAKASPFFHTMFTGDWAESAKTNTPIAISWPASALLVCLIHMYSDWLPTTPLPTDSPAVQKLLDNHGCALHDFGHTEWNQVVDLAEMLGLLHLARAAQEKAFEGMWERYDRLNKALSAAPAHEPAAKGKDSETKSEMSLL